MGVGGDGLHEWIVLAMGEDDVWTPDEEDAFENDEVELLGWGEMEIVMAEVAYGEGYNADEYLTEGCSYMTEATGDEGVVKVGLVGTEGTSAVVDAECHDA